MGRKKKVDRRVTTLDEWTPRFPDAPHGRDKNKLPDHEREALTVEAFRRKLEFMDYLLNRRLRGDLPDTEYWPTNPSEFHAWEHEDLGLYKLGSKSTVSPNGKYGAYLEQYENKRKKLERAFRDEVKDYKQANDALRKTNDALAQQNAYLIYSMQRICDELYLVTGRRTNLLDLLDEVRR
ncbi:hypothetical protein [Rhizobium hidalgonense]|uniref:Integrase n=1 Tax=Rhizobium hidalgonense TaxID=1538159 RepID=A0ABX4JJ17_9HYPH|nr:hypothetical protein [Rhizobium hidalgonense]PDT18993.1 hypothetical protein CO674_35700 [Rhizobium hidalgonense]PON02998.1 hypothetical protein ATY29_32080 [Rhizobium hidalgonense]